MLERYSMGLHYGKSSDFVGGACCGDAVVFVPVVFWFLFSVVAVKLAFCLAAAWCCCRTGFLPPAACRTGCILPLVFCGDVQN